MDQVWAEGHSLLTPTLDLHCLPVTLQLVKLLQVKIFINY